MRAPFLLPLLLVTVASVSLAQAPKPGLETRCGLGGIVPDSPWPGGSNPDQYVSGSPKVCAPPKGCSALRLKENAAGFEQFVFISGGKVAAVLREYDGVQEPKVLEALKARYGEPSNPNIATGKMGLITGKEQTRMVWLDAACNTRIEFVHQDTGLFKGKLNRSTRIAVLVTAAKVQKPGDSANPLD